MTHVELEDVEGALAGDGHEVPTVRPEDVLLVHAAESWVWHTRGGGWGEGEGGEGGGEAQGGEAQSR